MLINATDQGINTGLHMSNKSITQKSKPKVILPFLLKTNDLVRYFHCKRTCTHQHTYLHSENPFIIILVYGSIYKAPTKDTMHA